MNVTVINRDCWVVTVSELLSRRECRDLIALAEKVGFDDAPITTAMGFVHAPEIRNNTRVMLDDVPRAAALWERVRPHVPAVWSGWHAVGLNERFRFYRYEPGQYFRWHYDGCFARSARERSFITLMLYLNEDLEGGATDFEDFGSVTPETGKMLLFQHALRHQGAPVTGGRKYVLRTDVMYRDEPPQVV